MTEDQARVFEALKALLLAHVPPLVVLKDVPGDFQVTGPKPVVIDKRKMDSVWFAGIKANKGDITLHYLPIYGDPSLGERLNPKFMKVLKGKACFHMGAFNSELQEATAEALDTGVEAYKSRGWI